MRWELPKRSLQHPPRKCCLKNPRPMSIGFCIWPPLWSACAISCYQKSLQGGHPKQPDNASKRSWKHPAHNTAVGVRSLRVKRAVFFEKLYIMNNEKNNDHMFSKQDILSGTRKRIFFHQVWIRRVSSRQLYFLKCSGWKPCWFHGSASHMEPV